MSEPSDKVRQSLKLWRNDLVGLTRANRLLKFRPPKRSSLVIDAPSADDLLELVDSGRPLRFQAAEPPDDDEPPAPRSSAADGSRMPRDTVRASVPMKDLGVILRSLMRRANDEFLDKGLSVLYVSFGMLTWNDVDGSQMQSPLLLVPVTLIPEGPQSVPRLQGTDDDAVINPALTLRLQEFGVALPTTDDLDELTVTNVGKAARRALAKGSDFTGWSIQDTAHLATFSFTKEAMYKDLLDNEDVVLANPIVQALATPDPRRQTDEFQFDPIDPADIDREAPPETTPLVLDADSSQRAAVAAALRGHSFIMDGPPGTGKSQTIANMIGALLHAGKTVLFVSEKIAALDVVKDRLTAVGLGDYLLEVHSHKASRREVAAELLRALDNQPVPPPELGRTTRRSARDRRERLNAYADAMNEIREPLGVSLHHVLGLLAGLTDVPSAPSPAEPPMTMTTDDYEVFHDTVNRLVRVWRPARQGRSFVWRDVTDRTSMDIRLDEARHVLERLRGMSEVNHELCAAFALRKPSGASTLDTLLTLHHRDRPAADADTWLTEQRWSKLIASRDRLEALLDEIHRAEQHVIGLTGTSYERFPAESELESDPGPVDAAYRPVDLRPMTTAQLAGLAERFDARAQTLDEQRAAVRTLSASYGLPEPVTFADAEAVVRLFNLRTAGRLPDPRWLSSNGLAAARSAADELRASRDRLSAAEGKVRGTFTDVALDAPLDELQQRFTTLHRGLKKLSSGYRADKKTVAGLLTDARSVKDGIEHLSDALEWSRAAHWFNEATPRMAAALGRYWNGRETDLDAVAAAMSVAESAISITHDKIGETLAAYLGGTSSETPLAVVDKARSVFEEWNEFVTAPEEQGHRKPSIDILAGPIQNSITWLRTHIGPTVAAEKRVAAIDAVTSRVQTLAEANEILEAVAAARDAHRRLSDKANTLTAKFGSLFTFASTDIARLDSALEWAKRVREAAGGPLSHSKIQALYASSPVPELADAVKEWDKAQGAILDAFDPRRHAELRSELDNYSDAAELLENLQEDQIGQEEWFAYRSARSALEGLGLDPAVHFCIRESIGTETVARVLERALLRAWADGIIHGDERLHPTLAKDRTALVEEYRELDRDLIGHAVSDIIQAANSRRPANSTIGAPGVIRREGAKKRRNMAVRDLMAQAGSAAQAVKPVFMMSPLAVSQYLPPDIRFDVVICDEASQVTPGNAINCIYRGDAFILAGDDKQLPPTSFFDRVVDDEDADSDVQDFTSILDLAKGSGAFNNLGLKWHYRSRHESLIAFSNYKFYEGNLVTYPSSHVDGDDVGVAFFWAENGVYRRGAGHDNPGEAQEVARRVMEHFTRRPDLSLGVVTFSVAQAHAVQAAIDAARESHRDLDRFFDTEDRLGGFFIRSLESVQGDERDVMIMSVGYGPDEAGKTTANFGVLNQDKGWRRLNVAITRARQRMEVVASMSGEDVPVSTNENVEFLRSYLHYAEKGISTLSIEYGANGAEPESPFEESVLATIRKWGYTVEPQVGSAGYRIDMAVRHPDQPGMFSLGIECDGYQYHSAPAARDRDRLREEILRGLGWRLHRIWGTSWYRNRHDEEKKLHAAIRRAVKAPTSRPETTVTTIPRQAVTSRSAPVVTTPSWAVKYTVAPRVALPKWVDPAAEGSHIHMVDAMTTLADVEGPVHMDVIYERIKDWWDIGSVRKNVRENVRGAIHRSSMARYGEFLTVPNRAIDRVRIPAHGVSRKVDHIHLGELALAVTLLAGDVGNAAETEIIQQLARLFGWSRTGSVIDTRLHAAIDHALKDGGIERDGDLLRARSS